MSIGEPGPTPSQPVVDLPTMAQLDALSAELDDVDAVLARMDAQRTVSAPDQPGTAHGTAPGSMAGGVYVEVPQTTPPDAGDHRLR